MKNIDEEHPQNDKKTSNGSNSSFSTYDFSRTCQIPEDQKEMLTLIHQTYAEVLTTTLTTLFKTEVEIKFVELKQRIFADFISPLTSPSCIAVFDMQPLHGCAVIEIDSPVAYAAIDYMLGGDGTVPNIARSFTDLELAVMKKILQTLLKGFSSSWNSVIHINSGIKEIITNPALIRAIPLREICVTANLKITVGNTSGLINICVPYVNLEPITSKLSNKQWDSKHSIQQTEEVKKAHRKNFTSIPIDIVAQLGSIYLTMEELLVLQPEDILDLGQRIRQPIPIFLANNKAFEATPGLVGRQKGFRIYKELIKE